MHKIVHLVLKICGLQVALSPDPVLGMRWGTPGRLLPTHTGLELVMLSATSTLHAVALSHDVVDK